MISQRTTLLLVEVQAVPAACAATSEIVKCCKDSCRVVTVLDFSFLACFGSFFGENGSFGSVFGENCSFGSVSVAIKH